jgi:hypothetical protein
MHTVIPKKLTVPQLVKQFPSFKEPQGSLPHSQQPATCLRAEPDQSSYPPIALFEDQPNYPPIHA